MGMDPCGRNRGTVQRWKVSCTIFTIVTHCTATGRRRCGIEGRRTREHSVQDFEWFSKVMDCRFDQLIGPENFRRKSCFVRKCVVQGRNWIVATSNVKENSKVQHRTDIIFSQILRLFLRKFWIRQKAEGLWLFCSWYCNFGYAFVLDNLKL